MSIRRGTGAGTGGTQGGADDIAGQRRTDSLESMCSKQSQHEK